MKTRIPALLLTITLLLSIFLMTACSTSAVREKMLIGSWVEKHDPECYIVFYEDGTGVYHLDNYSNFNWAFDGNKLIIQTDDDFGQYEIVKLTKQELTLEPTRSGYWLELVRA